MSFAVMNVITAHFCQHALESAQSDQDNLVSQVISHRERTKNVLESLFRSCDFDGSGTITLTEFDSMLADESTHAVFESLGINIYDGWTLFKLLDDTQSSSVTLEKFLSGCLRLRGSATSMDLHSLKYDMDWLTNKVELLAQLVGTVSNTKSAAASCSIKASGSST